MSFFSWEKGKNLKNGFTLVELLAVIVVLAIILIIAVPGVLGIIQQSKEKSQQQQREMIEEAGRLYVTTDPDVVWTGQETKMTVVTLDMLQSSGYLDKKIVDPKTNKEITCAKIIAKKRGRNFEYQTEFCEQVNSSPRLSSNMIPIVYKDNKWVKADYMNKDNNWYNYEEQRWANMATVTETTRDAYKKADIGSEIKMEDINTMFVWIPRFQYKLWNVSGEDSIVGNENLAGDHMIDVRLEDTSTPKSNGSQNGQWLTHPAFTLNGQELEGFWMAKFEMGYTGTSDIGQIPVEQDYDKLVVKPNVSSWYSQNMTHIIQRISKMSDGTNQFGFTKVEDPHLARNMEWGAMVYLTYSQYGKALNPNYSLDEREVRVNNYHYYMTGCGANVQNEPWIDTCNSYETANGQAASTTGNITGVYDTSGGVWDAVAGIMYDESGQNVLVGESGFEQEELNGLAFTGNYFDLYKYSSDLYRRDRGHLGDATTEMGSGISIIYRTAWWDDNATFPEPLRPWVIRGSSAFSTTDIAGPTAYYLWNGEHSDVTGRIVVT